MDEADKRALRQRVMAVATADVDRDHPNEPENKRAIRIGYRAAYYLSELAWELQCEVSPALKRAWGAAKARAPGLTALLACTRDLTEGSTSFFLRAVADAAL
jgi:hypothetical protein